MGLVAVAGSVCTAAVGDKDQIGLDQINGLFSAVLAVYDLLGNLLAADRFNDHISDIHAVFDPDPVGLQIFYQRQDHALILIVFGETQCAEVRQSVDMVDIAAQIPFHFQRTGPALKCKHGLPVQPEVGLPERIRQNVGDLLVLQIFFRCQKQLGKRQRRFLVQRKLLVGVRILATVHGGTAEGIVGVVLVQPVIFVQHRDVGRFDGRNIPECIPHDFEMVVHFSAATHEESFCDVLASVTAATGKFQLFQQVNVFAFHLTVTNQIKGCGKTGETGTDDISRLFVHVLRLFGVCK